MTFDEILKAAAEAVEEAAVPRIGRDLGTIHRDAIVGAGLAAAFRALADHIDRGPAIPLPPSVYSALVREYAEDFERIGVSP